MTILAFCSCLCAELYVDGMSQKCGMTMRRIKYGRDGS